MIYLIGMILLSTSFHSMANDVHHFSCSHRFSEAKIEVIKYHSNEFATLRFYFVKQEPFEEVLSYARLEHFDPNLETISFRVEPRSRLDFNYFAVEKNDNHRTIRGYLVDKENTQFVFECR